MYTVRKNPRTGSFDVMRPNGRDIELSYGDERVALEYSAVLNGVGAPLYQAMFPDFTDMPDIPAGFVDQSWRNDTCPSFAKGPLVLFVDYADPAKREFPETERFSLRVGEDDAFASDDWAVMSLMIKEIWEEIYAGESLAQACIHARFRLGHSTRSDIDTLIAENDAADSPCPDLRAHLNGLK